MRPMLLGPDAEPTLLEQDIDALFLSHPRPVQSDLVDFLRLYTKGSARNFAAQQLVARGLQPDVVGKALAFADMASTMRDTVFTKRNVIGVLTLVAAGANAYHGYRRNQSIGWSIAWFGSSMLFPIFTSAIALAQGFGQRKGA